jgi:hypothetical protein
LPWVLALPPASGRWHPGSRVAGVHRSQGILRHKYHVARALDHGEKQKNRESLRFAQVL